MSVMLPTLPVMLKLCREETAAMFSKRALAGALTILLLAASAFAQERRQPAEVGRISVAELKELLAADRAVTIIDVRTLDSYQQKIKGALSIPLTELETRLGDIPRDREIVTYCA